MIFPSDVSIVKLNSLSDNRGCLDVIFEQEISNQISLKRSISKKNVFRGMHYQKLPFLQKKVIQVISGTVIDILINMDTESEFYGKIYEKEISAKNSEVIHIPEHYAHGFIAITETVFQYITFGKYSSENEISIKLPESYFSKIRINKNDLIISDKDINAISHEDYFNRIYNPEI